MRKHKELKICGVYEIVNLVNGCRYVGSTENLSLRHKTHFELLKRNCHFNILIQQDYNKLGKDAFFFFVIEHCTKESHFEREEFHLNLLRLTNIDVYNIGSIKGGDNLTRHPNRKDIIRRIAKSMTGKKRKPRYGNENANWRGGLPKCQKCGSDIAKVNKTGFCGNCIDKTGERNPFYGKFHSQETRNRLSIASSGKKSPNRIPLMIDGVRYESLNDARDALGIHITTIRYRVYSKNIKYKDWYPFGKEKDFENLYTREPVNKIKIVCDGIVFDSLIRAARHYGLSTCAIRHRVKSKNYPNFYLVDKTDIQIVGYTSHPAIKGEVAV